MLLASSTVLVRAKWVVVAGVAAIVLIVVAFLVLQYWRRRMAEPGDAGDAVWTLDDLRKMRDRGDLTDEEYGTMRAVLIRAFKGEGPRHEAPVEPAWDWVAEDAERTGNGDSRGHETDFDVKKSPQH